MSDFVPVFAALTIACLASVRLAPVKWRGRFYALALVSGLVAVVLLGLRFAPDLSVMISAAARN